jgi:2-polyprenyl-6-methoxyphenol hydroxylase-like FAD-dependent oxidoreductase
MNTTQPETRRTPVLIVGAGPVGLALAIELGQRSVNCLVVERNDRVGYAPRAKTTHSRTREHLRRWGIADKLSAASPLGVDYPSNIIFVTRLCGYPLARFDNAFYCAPRKNPLYAEHAQWIPQYVLEEVLRAHAQSLPGVDIRFNCEFLAYQQNAQGVHTQIRDAGGGYDSILSVTSDYLIGADGARSSVREAIGAQMQGVHGMSSNYNIVFRAPGLAQAHRHGPAVMYWQVNADLPGLIGPMDRDDRWFFMPTKVTGDRKPADFETPALISKATGIDLPYQILSADAWTANRLIADRYRDRRVFLAGDACHLHPPFGGYGMNMGIADGVDLGWKLAALLQGWGGPALLDSYERERRPVHDFVMDEAVANHALLGNQLWQDGLEDDSDSGAELRRVTGERIRAAKIREFDTLGVVLGYRYENSPVIVGDGSPPPPREFRNYLPSAHPGCRAPHAWLADGSSLYGHFGPGFTLLVDEQGSDIDIEEVHKQARAAGIPLTILQPGVPAIAELYQARYTLIRPDHHVAWRGNDWPDRAEAVFRRIAGFSEPETSSEKQT